jgi:hypothetical protein
VDLGFPEVRASVQALPSASGTYDQTQYTGARTVSIEGVVFSDSYGPTPTMNGWDPTIPWNSSSYFISLLSSWANPSRRFRLYWTDESGRSRYMDVRGDSFTAPVSKVGHSYREFQLNLVNPSGKIYSFAEGGSATVDGRFAVPIGWDVDNLSGRTYALTEPRTYPAPDGSEGLTNNVRYNGTIANGFQIVVYTGTTSDFGNFQVVVFGPDGTAQYISVASGTVGLLSMPTIPGRPRLEGGSTITLDTESRDVYLTNPLVEGRVQLQQSLSAPLQWPQLRPGISYQGGTVQSQVSGYNEFQFGFTTAIPDDASITVYYKNADLA